MSPEERIRRNLAENVALAGAVAIFPFFFFYHLLIAMFHLPLFLGGGFAYPALATSLLLFVLSFFGISTIPRSAAVYLAIFILFMGYLALWTLVNGTLIRGEYVTVAVVQSAEAWGLLFALFLIGFYINPSSQRFQKIFFLSLVAIFLILASHVALTGNVMFVASRYFGADNIASYQGFSRSVFILSIILIALLSTLRTRFFVAGAGLFSLFVLGARSEFVAFVMVLVGWLSLISVQNVRYFAASVIFLAGIGGLVFLTWDTLAENRQAQLISLEDMNSWQKRNDLSDIAVEQLKQNPILGMFGGHVEARSAGEYAHNALSAWVNYGIIGFVFYTGLTLYALIYSWLKSMKRAFRKRLWLLSFFLNFASFIFIVGAKAIFWPVPAFGWGIFAQALYLDSYIRKKSTFPKGN